MLLVDEQDVRYYTPPSSALSLQLPRPDNGPVPSAALRASSALSLQLTGRSSNTVPSGPLPLLRQYPFNIQGACPPVFRSGVLLSQPFYTFMLHGDPG
jgi:hypothetical protein